MLLHYIDFDQVYIDVQWECQRTYHRNHRSNRPGSDILHHTNNHLLTVHHRMFLCRSNIDVEMHYYGSWSIYENEDFSLELRDILPKIQVECDSGSWCVQ